MALKLKCKKVDLGAGEDLNILLNNIDAQNLGVNEGEKVLLGYKDMELYVDVVLTDKNIDAGEIGLYDDLWEQYMCEDGDEVYIDIPKKSEAIEFVRKKMSGQRLSKDEIYTVMTEIGNGRLGDTEVAFFISTFFHPGFNDDEIYYLTRSMAETGEMFTFKDIKDGNDIVVDKHSIGGTAGKGVTPILISILACADLVIPNTSTRAITSPAGTSDILEVVMPVSLASEQIYETVKEIGACMVWGGALKLAPADDVFINVERFLRMQDSKKVLVSIVAKKLAMGLTHVLIDLPYGRTLKIEQADDAQVFEREFKKLLERVGIKCATITRKCDGPDGNSVGPALEMREVLRILERDSERSVELEKTVIDMAGRVFELVDKYSYKEGKKYAQEILDSGEALEKFWNIALKQGTKKMVKASDIALGQYTQDIKSDIEGKIRYFNTKGLVTVARELGTPKIKEAGIFLHKKAGDNVKKGEVYMTIYATSKPRLEAGLKATKEIEIINL